MKLVRFGPAGREKPGIIDKQGKLRDLSRVVPDIAGDVLSGPGLAKIKKAKLEKLPLVKGKPRLGACVNGTRHFIAIGLNYADHAAEAGAPIPKEPITFTKAPSCIVGPNDNIMVPKDSTKTRLGSRARHRDRPPRALRRFEKDALAYIAGYCVCNDVSEREFQIERSGQWMKGKGCETFGPIGPWLVTRDEIKDVQNLSMWLTVNGEQRQKGSTKTMIFGARSHRLVLLAVLRHGAGRRHHHRHAPRRRPRHEAAAIPEARRRDPPRHRGPRRAAAEGSAI